MLSKKDNPIILNWFYRFAIMIALILWVNGFPGHSRVADYWGGYTLPFFTFLLCYSLGMLGWFILLTSKGILVLTNIIDYIQGKWQFIALVGIISGILIWFILKIPLNILEIFAYFPDLQWSLIALILLGNVVVLFTKGIQVEDKIFLLYPLYLLLVVEISFQLLALFGLLPISLMFPFNEPYSRVYWLKEGLGDGITNNYGWYYPEFRLEDDSKKIAIIGDSFIHALQINPSQHTGIALEKLINQNYPNETKTEVLAFGISGAGPAHYLEMIKYAITYFEVDEIFVFICLGNDFLSTTGYCFVFKEIPYPVVCIQYIEDEAGKLELHPQSIQPFYELQQQLQRGHEPLSSNVYPILESYLITPKVLKFIKIKFDELPNSLLDKKPFKLFDDRDIQGLYKFYQGERDSETQKGIRVTTKLLKMSQEYATSHGVKIHLVTIPFFPPDFYRQYQSTDWDTEVDIPDIGHIDLILPERIMVEFAQNNDIPILPMTKYMYDDRLEVEYIKTLYYFNGSGHLTPEGHAYFAQAIYDYFYAEK